MAALTVTYRPVSPSDEPFLFRLYAGTRGDFDLLPLPPRQKEALLRMQYQAQAQTYLGLYRETEHRIVLVDGDPAAQVWVDETPDEVRIVDVTVAPEFRRRGVGTQVVHTLMQRAARSGKPLRHSVLMANLDAIRFYLGLGYRITGNDSVYHSMEWRAAQ